MIILGVLMEAETEKILKIVASLLLLGFILGFSLIYINKVNISGKDTSNATIKVISETSSGFCGLGKEVRVYDFSRPIPKVPIDVKIELNPVGSPPSLMKIYSATVKVYDSSKKEVFEKKFTGVTGTTLDMNITFPKADVYTFYVSAITSFGNVYNKKIGSYPIGTGSYLGGILKLSVPMSGEGNETATKKEPMKGFIVNPDFGGFSGSYLVIPFITLSSTDLNSVVNVIERTALEDFIVGRGLTIPTATESVSIIGDIIKNTLQTTPPSYIVADVGYKLDRRVYVGDYGYPAYDLNFYVHVNTTFEAFKMLFHNNGGSVEIYEWTLDTVKAQADIRPAQLSYKLFIGGANVLSYSDGQLNYDTSLLDVKTANSDELNFELKKPVTGKVELYITNRPTIPQTIIIPVVYNGRSIYLLNSAISNVIDTGDEIFEIDQIKKSGSTTNTVSLVFTKDDYSDLTHASEQKVSELGRFVKITSVGSLENDVLMELKKYNSSELYSKSSLTEIFDFKSPILDSKLLVKPKLLVDKEMRVVKVDITFTSDALVTTSGLRLPDRITAYSISSSLTTFSKTEALNITSSDTTINVLLNAQPVAYQKLGDRILLIFNNLQSGSNLLKVFLTGVNGNIINNVSSFEYPSISINNAPASDGMENLNLQFNDWSRYISPQDMSPKVIQTTPVFNGKFEAVVYVGEFEPNGAISINNFIENDLTGSVKIGDEYILTRVQSDNPVISGSLGNNSVSIHLPVPNKAGIYVEVRDFGTVIGCDFSTPGGNVVTATVPVVGEISIDAYNWSAGKYSIEYGNTTIGDEKHYDKSYLSYFNIQNNTNYVTITFIPNIDKIKAGSLMTVTNGKNQTIGIYFEKLPVTIWFTVFTTDSMELFPEMFKRSVISMLLIDSLSGKPLYQELSELSNFAGNTVLTQTVKIPVQIENSPYADVYDGLSEIVEPSGESIVSMYKYNINTFLVIEQTQTGKYGSYILDLPYDPNVLRNYFLKGFDNIQSFEITNGFNYYFISDGRFSMLFKDNDLLLLPNLNIYSSPTSLDFDVNVSTVSLDLTSNYKKKFRAYVNYIDVNNDWSEKKAYITIQQKSSGYQLYVSTQNEMIQIPTDYYTITPDTSGYITVEITHLGDLHGITSNSQLFFRINNNVFSGMTRLDNLKIVSILNADAVIFSSDSITKELYVFNDAVTRFEINGSYTIITMTDNKQTVFTPDSVVGIFGTNALYFPVNYADNKNIIFGFFIPTSGSGFYTYKDLKNAVTEVDVSYETDYATKEFKYPISKNNVDYYVHPYYVGGVTYGLIAVGLDPFILSTISTKSPVITVSAKLKDGSVISKTITFQPILVFTMGTDVVSPAITFAPTVVNGQPRLYTGTVNAFHVTNYVTNGQTVKDDLQVYEINPEHAVYQKIMPLLIPFEPDKYSAINSVLSPYNIENIIRPLPKSSSNYFPIDVPVDFMIGHSNYNGYLNRFILITSSSSMNINLYFGSTNVNVTEAVKIFSSGSAPPSDEREFPVKVGSKTKMIKIQAWLFIPKDGGIYAYVKAIDESTGKSDAKVFNLFGYSLSFEFEGVKFKMCWSVITNTVASGFQIIMLH